MPYQAEVTNESTKKKIIHSKQKKRNSETESESKDEIIRKLRKRIAELEKEKYSNTTSNLHGPNSNMQPCYVKEEFIEEIIPPCELNMYSGGDNVKETNIEEDNEEDRNIEEGNVEESNIEVDSNITYPRLCDICFKSCKTQTSFTKHLGKHKKKRMNNCNTNRRKKCIHCGGIFTNNNKEYLSHIRQCNRTRILKKLKTLSRDRDMNHDDISQTMADLFGQHKSKEKISDENILQCHDCSTMYLTRPSFIKHLKKNICGNMSKRISCTYDDCTIKFTRYEHFLHHLPHYHNDYSYLSKNKYFANFTMFEDWRAQEQNHTFSYLVKSRGSKTYKGTEYNYYECQFNAVCEGKRGPKRKTERRKKAGIIPHLFCPARMTVSTDIATGVVWVNYIEKHSHELSYEYVKKYQRFPRSIVNHITGELRKGVSPIEVLQFYHGKLNHYDNNSKNVRKMTDMISLNFIRYLKRKLLEEERDVKEESEEVENYEVRFGSDVDTYELIRISSVSTETYCNDNQVGYTCYTVDQGPCEESSTGEQEMCTEEQGSCSEDKYLTEVKMMNCMGPSIALPLEELKVNDDNVTVQVVMFNDNDYTILDS
ncbi:hypothetical protein M8J77_025326 [Diaphorina citri]|nr:hypothetical protein M8J77_025326 [Diaphorina citri]